MKNGAPITANRGPGERGKRHNRRTAPIHAYELSERAKSRITRGEDILPWVDGRGLLAKRYRDIFAQLALDQGSGDSDLPEVRLQLLRRFAGCAVLAEQLEARMVVEQPIKVEEYTQLISTLVRVASRIGLDRIPKNVTPVSLRDYLHSRSEAAE